MKKTAEKPLRPGFLEGVLLLLTAAAVSGCAGIPAKGPGQVSPGAGVLPPGTYHKVERGQTLWKISRMYGLELQELIEANAITDSAKISTGQLLRIPGDKKPLPVLPAPGPGQSVPSDDEEFIWPVRGEVLFSYGEERDSGVSRGIAIAPGRSDMVVASRSGRVVFYSADFLDFGKTLIVEHPDGFWTVYGRNAEVFVKIGDVVQRGTAIGKAGRGGRDPGRYLYFEIRKGHVSQNPNFYLPR